MNNIEKLIIHLLKSPPSDEMRTLVILLDLIYNRMKRLEEVVYDLTSKNYAKKETPQT